MPPFFCYTCRTVFAVFGEKDGEKMEAKHFDALFDSTPTEASVAERLQNEIPGAQLVSWESVRSVPVDDPIGGALFRRRSVVKIYYYPPQEGSE